MSYQDDKRELLKLKQGLIEESEKIHEEEKPVYELHGFKKVENFFYHYKWHVIVGIFFAAVVIFLAVNLLTKKNGDIRVLVVTKDSVNSAQIQYKTEELRSAFELYCRDYDKSGYIYVDVYTIDLSESTDPQYSLAQITKVMSEAMFGEAQLYLVDKLGAAALCEDNEEVFVDLEALYPDCPYINGRYLQIKGSGFDVNAQYYSACPEDLYLVVHNVSENAQNASRAIPAMKKALEVVDNIVNGNYAGWVDDQGRIYGITQKETTDAKGQ